MLFVESVKFCTCALIILCRPYFPNGHSGCHSHGVLDAHVGAKQHPEDGVSPAHYVLCQSYKTTRQMRSWQDNCILLPGNIAAIILLKCSLSSDWVQEMCTLLSCTCRIPFHIPFSWLIKKKSLIMELKKFCMLKRWVNLCFCGFWI